MNYLLSLLRLKCPQCRSGKMFSNAPYALIGFPKVLERCPNCKVKFSQEPSFFYGSMYVSYALGVGLAIVVFFLLYFLGWVQSPTPIFIAIVVVISILSPYIYQLSKVMWASFFIPYRGEVKTKIKND